MPALLEYIPYRKGDGTAIGDSTRHAYFAGHGYACVRVDLRGSGDSEGVLLDEYLPQEQDDAVEVLAWLAAQPWCTGATGMFGISWGGFNSLQVAARRPPSLKAIITLCSTDDRYADDVHYMGGCLLAVVHALVGLDDARVQRAAARPGGRRASAGGRCGCERLEAARPSSRPGCRTSAATPTGSRARSARTTRRSSAPSTPSAAGPTPYRNAVLRLLEGLRGPRKGLIGPWAHTLSRGRRARAGDRLPAGSAALVGPLAQGRSTPGIMDEPHAARLDAGARSSRRRSTTSGRAAGSRSRAGPRPRSRASIPLALRRGPRFRDARDRARLATGARTEGPASSLPTSVSRTGSRSASRRSPLDEPLEILGLPGGRADARRRPAAGARLRPALRRRPGRRLAARHPRACSTSPTATATSSPRRSCPGERYTVRVRLNAIAHAFPPGHRLRVAVSPTYWPWAWPSPESVTLTVHDGRLELPVRPTPGRRRARTLRRPRSGRADWTRDARAQGGRPRSSVEIVVTGHTSSTWSQDCGGGSHRLPRQRARVREPAGTTGSRSSRATPSRPRPARRGRRASREATGGSRVETSSTLSADAKTFS